MENSYIKFDQLLRAWDNAQKSPLNTGQRSVLAEIGRRESIGLSTRMTDLYQQFRFGTGPTIFAHLVALESNGLISKVPSKKDARSFLLVLTAAGRDYLQALDSLVRSATL